MVNALSGHVGTPSRIERYLSLIKAHANFWFILFTLLTIKILFDALVDLRVHVVAHGINALIKLYSMRIS
jgi:hypothetical protein